MGELIVDFLRFILPYAVRVYQSTIDLIRQLRENEFKLAIVSSSKNCLSVLRTANIENLFDTRVDGLVSEEIGLQGKPEPDIFLEAAARLDIDIKRCVVVEDALSGVEDGHKGGFGLVLGVNRGDQAAQLKAQGADLVVDDLSEVKVGILVKNLPNALQAYDRIIETIGGKEIVIILDYDSILSHLGPLPQNVKFYKDIEHILSSLAGQFTVIIISQDKPELIQNQLKIENILYAGSHGTVIKSSEEFITVTDPPETDDELNKGSIFFAILEKLNLVSQSICPVYFGDNLKDRDVFEALGHIGIGITMGSGRNISSANYRFDIPKQIGLFLSKLSSNLAGGTSWGQIYSGFDPGNEGQRESLCALGNGYFVTRGAAPESTADSIHYPGTYLTGGYNRLKTNIGGKVVENEDLVNIPNWLFLNFRISDGEWFCIQNVEIIFYRQYLNIKKGILNRTIRFRDKQYRETILLQHSFVHGNLMHRAALRTCITPLNWRGKLEICSALDGRVTNLGVKRYRDLGNSHLDLVESHHLDDKSIALKVRTNQSGLDIAISAKTELFLNDSEAELQSVQADKPGGYIAKNFSTAINTGETLTVDKLVSIYTSKDTGIFECLTEASESVTKDSQCFDSLLRSHITAWKLLWQKFDVRLKTGDKDTEKYIQKTIRLYIFHLLQSSSVHSLDIDVGMPARGWHGEGYRGHIFWDEMIIFPFLNFRIPRITKTLLMYRYRRLKEAKQAALNAGHRGAMYPWQSGSNGREETQQMHLNPVSGRWLPDHTHLQRHVNIAIVYNIAQYFQITNDIEFLSFYGGEITIEIARFWASIASYDHDLDRYEIRGVMGPDEYHDSYPGAEKPGLNNNAYTNIMVMFVMDQALNIQSVIPEHDWDSLKKKLEIEDHELEVWKKMSRRMKVIFHDDGIISQFEGYAALKELDWQSYREKYGNIQRLDRILEKEGDSANNYKLCKQPDVLMLFYLFSGETLRKMFKRLDYTFNKQLMLKNINYYLRRTTNGSSLALTIHAWIEARQARERSWDLFRRALETDMVTERTGSTMEGIHLAAMSGCIDILQRGYAGLEIRSDILILNPLLPEIINCIFFHIRYRKHWLEIEINQEYVKVESLTSKATPFTVMIKEEIIRLYPGKKAIVAI